MKKVKLIDSITHQGIGGKWIILEKHMKTEDAPLNIALQNYLIRRDGEYADEVYYGHINNLGYFVSEDEFACEPVEATDEDIRAAYKM